MQTERPRLIGYLRDYAYAIKDDSRQRKLLRRLGILESISRARRRE